MKVYKNVGVYVLCRIGKHADAEIYRNSAKDNYHKPSDEIWENIIFYTDDVELGKVSDRQNLQKLINDALSGKIDRIYINSMWDFWHNPQKLFDTIRNFNSMFQPVNMTFNIRRRNPPIMVNTVDESGWFHILQDILQNQEVESAFMFAAANWDCLTDELKDSLVSCHINAEMLYAYLFDFHIVARDMEWDDLQKEIGLSDEDTYRFKGCWMPTSDGFIKILNWSENQFLQYYLA